jgi:small-conductance mechanosensitive channel
MDKPNPLESWTGLVQQLDNLVAHLSIWFQLLMGPPGLLQLLLIAVIAALAWLGGRLIEPPIERWVRGRDTTLRRMRFYALVLRRVRLILFVLLALLVVAALRRTMSADRSHIVLIAANLVGVWVIVSITSRLIRNRLAARIVAVGAWLIASLNILGLTQTAATVLDAAAVNIGDFRVSLLLLLKAGLVLTILFWLASAVSAASERRLEKVEDMSPSMRVLTGKLVRIGLFALAVLIGLQSTGLNLTGLTVFSGAVGLGLGFGMQKVVSNLVSGVILLVDRSIKPGDVISLGETFGWISRLNARYASVVTRDGREFLIPNEDLVTNQVVNWSYSDKNVRLEVPFGVSYASDPHLVRRLAVEAALRARRILKTPEVVCHLTSFGDSSVNFLLRFWIADPEGGVVNVKSDVLLALWDALKENGIEIPYPQRDVHLRAPREATVAAGSSGAR